MMRNWLLILGLQIISLSSWAQEALPDFTIETLPARGYRISWQNPFGKNLKQLSVQRAAGNKTGFTTIFSTSSPQLPENGFIDRPPGLFRKYYYRIFYVLNGNQYFFTLPKAALHQVFEPDKKGMMRIWMNDQFLKTIPDHHFKAWRDSIARNPRLEIIAKGPGEILLISDPVKYTNNASGRVSINTEGHVEIRLGNAVNDYRFSILFKDPQGLILVKLENIREPLLTLEKSNFIRSGTYYYELYEETALIEKSTINIQ
ncbi:MAG: hypothetical protein RIR90_870 [Bacteroidota bacterium]|jgi:hypothetical protein